MSTGNPPRAQRDPPPSSSSSTQHPPSSSGTDHHRFHFPSHLRLQPNTRSSRHPTSNSNVSAINTSHNQHSGERDKEKERPFHSYRQHAKDTVQSAIDLRPPFDLLRRDRGDKSSASGSNDAAASSSKPNGNAAASPPTTATAAAQITAYGPLGEGDILIRTRKGLRPVEATPEHVARAKSDNALREIELRKALSEVEEMGMSRTRQLDDSYYAILEKASIFRSTVSNLQLLAEEVERARVSFCEAADSLEKETGEGIESFNGFEQQGNRVAELLSALERERAETEGLNKRLEDARMRVEMYERREELKRAKRRTRGYVGGLVVMAVVALVAAILLARNRRSVGQRLDTVGHQLALVGDVVEGAAAPLAAKLRARPSPSEDPYLRKLFDEL